MSNSFINKLQKIKSKYANPTQASTQAKSLDLLSSGIYTEEERFVFELLQNAVDAYNGTSCLNVRIILLENYLVFMHNGDKFSERDIEGLCDVGYGNKMADIKKIGYKGIGFKSVFMHSQLVTVQSGEYCFKFEKAQWDNYWDSDWGTKDDSRKYSMPWQIIPIETTAPVDVDADGFNVITYIKTSKSSFLKEKIQKLFSSSSFLLFLRHTHINIDFIHNNQVLIDLCKHTNGDIVELLTNNSVDSKWLVYCNPEVKIDDDIREIIATDGITPIKLQEAKTFDISFALLLDNKGRIGSLENSCVYTYLPTSISFGFPFLVNANFITDAGRQHLVNDSEWNRMIMGNIPNEFLTWMSNISKQHKTYYKALPALVEKDDKLSKIFDRALREAINRIAFIPSLTNVMLKANEAIMDRVGISTVLPKEILLRHVKSNYQLTFNNDSFINNAGIAILREYGVFDFDAAKLIGLFEEKEAFEGISINKDVELIKFLRNYYDKNEKDRSTLANILSQVRFLYAEDDSLDCPNNLFFPSNYRDEEEIAHGAKVLHEDLYNILLTDDSIISWLKEVGLCEMNEISIIKNLLTTSRYVTTDNAIEVGRYIFNAFKKYNLQQEVGPGKLSNIKFITKNGTLKSIGELFLGHEFKPEFDLEIQYNEDVFISEKYADGKDLDDWALFFRKMGICTGIKPKEMHVSWNDLPSYTQNFLQECKDTVLTYSNPYMDWTNPFSLHYFSLHYFPLVTLKDTPHGLAKIIWNYLLKETLPEFTEDRACGVYGACLGASFGITKWTHLKYGTWALKNHQTFPASTGEMLMASELYKNTPLFKELFGEYLPYLDVDCEIDNSWNEILSFKTDPPLEDFLSLLSNIADDESKADENKQRISKIYQHIVESFSFDSEKNTKIIKNWAQEGKILSREGVFVKPSELRHISLDGFSNNQRVYIGQVENRNKVIDLLEIMGVKIITENSVKPEIQNQEERDEIKRCLSAKAKVLALLKAGEKPSKEEYEKELTSINTQLNETHFYHCSSIKLTYGNDNDTIEKVTFGNNSNFFYTGEIRLAKIDPLLTPLCNYLQLKGKERELIVTMFEDISAIREYLQEKEYDVSFLEDVQDDSSHIFTTSLNYSRNDEQRRRDALTGHLGEIIVYEKLKDMGYSPKCLSLADENDYEDIVEYKGKKYYCKPNFGRYDIEFETETGGKMLVEVKSTTLNKESQENMPISYREISLVEEYSNNEEVSYVIIRVFNVNSSTPDIYIFKGHTI